jgi:hypothetical protein
VNHHGVAALDVVHRRLTGIGLAPFDLDELK